MSGYDTFAWIVLLILVASAIDTTNTIIGIEINQIDARYVALGQEVETTFKFAPDDDEFARRLPAGSTGTAAIYTEHLKPTHMVRRVLLRQVAISNYVNPF